MRPMSDFASDRTQHPQRQNRARGANNLVQGELDCEWNQLKQGDLSVQQFANEIFRLADLFTRLARPATKSVHELFLKFLRGAKPLLQHYILLIRQKYWITENEPHADTLKKFHEIVYLTSSYEAMSDAIGLTSRLHHSVQKSHGRASSVSSDSGTTPLPLGQTLCRVHASGHHCSYGKKCRRLHMTADEFMRHPFFALQSEREQVLIRELDHPSASPGHADSHAARRPRGVADLGATRSWSSQGSYDVQTLDLDEIPTPTVAAISAQAPRTKQTSKRKLTLRILASTCTSSEKKSVMPTESDIPPVTKVTPCTHVSVFLGDRAATCFRMKLDNCSEAPRSMISHNVYTKCIAPQGYTLRPVPANDFRFSACNHTQLPTEGCVRIPIFFHKPTPGATPNFTLTVYVMAADSGCDDDFLVCIGDLRKLGMALNLRRNWVQFENLKPSPRIELNTTLSGYDFRSVNDTPKFKDREIELVL